MQLIKEEKINKELKDLGVWNFNIEKDGIYALAISARCKNWRQNWQRLFDDDDLAIQIDDYLFAEIKGKKREFVSAGSWNGNELKNSSKNVFFLLPFKAGTHKIIFWVGGHPILNAIEIYECNLGGMIEVVSSLKSDFIKGADIIFKNIKTEELRIEVLAEKDSKLELKIDGKIQENAKYKRYKKWFWYGQELQGKSKEFVLPYCFEGGVHSLEFRGEGQPQIKSVKIKISGDRLRCRIGRVKLWKDITSADVVNLRSVAHTKNGGIIAELKDGDELEIVNERVVGEYQENLSEIWHEVIYKDKKGFVLSSFIEIEGQEREKIIDLIKEKCRQYVIDANIILAIAGHESHYKPYAKSVTGCRGIFQLSIGTADWIGRVEDRYDFYQNIDGGVRNYKKIEEKFVGRGNIFEKRLVAWHDGINSIPVRGPVDYSSLDNPAETRNFVRNVLKNTERKDWLDIISLPLSVLIVILGFFIAYSFYSNGQEYADVNYYLGQVISPSPEVKNGEVALPLGQTRLFPAVILQEEDNRLTFMNSDGKTVGEIDTELLNLDEVFRVSADFTGISGKNLTFIEPKILEYPKDVFYFFAATSWTCGANNCAFAFFRFDAENKELELISNTVFGSIGDLFLSPDFHKLALLTTDHGGVSAENDHISIFDLSNFRKQDIKNYFDWNFSAHYIKEFSWKNNEEIEFNVKYTNLPSPKAKESIWLYNIDDHELRKIKTEEYALNMSG